MGAVVGGLGGLLYPELLEQPVDLEPGRGRLLSLYYGGGVVDCPGRRIRIVVVCPGKGFSVVEASDLAYCKLSCIECAQILHAKEVAHVLDIDYVELLIIRVIPDYRSTGSVIGYLGGDRDVVGTVYWLGGDVLVIGADQGLIDSE